MKRLLIRVYPARWRARYGDEFEAILDERPLGPFDVADILLGALDARLRLRGRRDAISPPTRGFPMSLRIGGLAAIAFGVLVAVSIGGSIGILPPSLDPAFQLVFFSVASLLLLLALVGLSATQARAHPRLIWAAVAIPAAGAVLTLVGMLGMALFGDNAVVAGVSSWYFFMFGIMAAFLGSALFAIATYRTGTLSRPGAALVAIGTAIPIAASAPSTPASSAPISTETSTASADSCGCSCAATPTAATCPAWSTCRGTATPPPCASASPAS